MEEHLLSALLAIQTGFIDLDVAKKALREAIDERRELFETEIITELLDQERLNELRRIRKELLRRSRGDLKSAIELLSSADRTKHELLGHLNAPTAELAPTDSLFSEVGEDVSGRHETPNQSSNSVQDRYRILRKHAEGGLGVVYLAEDRECNRNVALKQIKPECAGSSTYQQKFSRESEITGQLEHPSIVPIYSRGADENDRPYYAMRFIDGRTFKKEIREFHERLELNEERFNGPGLRSLLRRFADVCNAVEYAHQKGVVHRDLKPSNVMLGKLGDTLVVDWGLAKSLHQEDVDAADEIRYVTSAKTTESNSDTKQGQFVGTAAYAPPEQLRGELDAVSERSDIYSLGAMLFEVLSGRPPVTSADSIPATIEQIEQLQREPHATSCPGAPGALVAIAKRAMEPIPENRYASAESLFEDVQRWLDDESVTSYAEPLNERVLRWIRSHPTASAASVLTVLALIASSSIYFAGESRRLEVERDKLIAEDKIKRERWGKLAAEATMAGKGGNSDEAIAKLRQLESEQGSLNTDQQITVARHLIFAQNLEPAFTRLESLMTRDLTDSQKATIDLLTGDILLSTKRNEEGIRLVEASLNSETLDGIDLLYAKAIAASSPVEAETLLFKLLELDRFHSYARVRLALTQAVMGKPDSAIKSADQGTLLHPNDWRFDAVRALAYATLGNEKSMNSELGKFSDNALAKDFTDIVPITFLLYQIATSIASGKQKGVQLQDLASAFEVASSFSSAQTERGKFDPTIPSMGWFDELFAAFESPSMNTVELTQWLFGLTAFNKAEKYVKNLAVFLPDSKVWNTVAAGYELTSQDRQNSKDYQRVLKFADAARMGEGDYAGFNPFLASIAVSAIALPEGQSRPNPGFRSQQMVTLVHWKEFLKENAKAGSGMDAEARVNTWRLFIRYGLPQDAIIIAKRMVESVPDQSEIQRRWQQRLELAQEFDPFTEEWIKALQADFRHQLPSGGATLPNSNSN